VTKQRYFSNFEKCLSIFGHRLECTKPKPSRLQNIGFDSGLRLPGTLYITGQETLRITA